MNRRSFIAGLLGSTATVALPHPNVPTGGDTALAAEFIPAENYFSQPIGIALNSGARGDLIDVLLTRYNTTVRLMTDRPMEAGEAMTSNDTALWVEPKTEGDILDDIVKMKSILMENDDAQD